MNSITFFLTFNDFKFNFIGLENKRVTNTYSESSANSQRNGTGSNFNKDSAKLSAAKTQGTGATFEDRNKSPENNNRASTSGRTSKKNVPVSNKTTTTKPKVAASNPGDSSFFKKKFSPASTSDQELEEELPSASSNGAPKSTNNGCYLYNICKNESSSKANSSAKKAAQPKQTSSTTAAAPLSSTGARGGVSKSERFTDYLHRRQQRSSRQKSGYDLVLKVLEKWLELVLRLVVWLFDLVSDVVILSGGMLWEGSQFVFEYSMHLYEVARKELRQNSGRPTAICKAWLLQFDKRFAIDSRWAVWRKFVKKQVQPTEQVRCGRLPTTGDEAMYSLLNCKGKDAYR